jgi:signal transduction histidine kinase
VELRVERTGDPISHGVLQALFDPFDLNDDATGITIGLYLARALTVAHGGTLGLEQDDRGAVFHVRIPLVRTTSMEDRAGRSTEE